MKLFTLVAELTLDTGEFVRSVNDAKGAFTSIDSSSAVAQAVALGNALYDVSKRAIEMAVNLGEAIYGGYADTEQLVGGVATIFGEDAQTVIDNANKAFYTAGMSANDYMDSVIGFSTRLLQGLEGDTTQAAYYADLALTDMADNVNKFGSSLNMVQNAYQGFSRNNFTMLDNLRLGYGGTQEEMVRLINDSGVAVGMFVDEAENLRDMEIADLQSFPLFKMFEAIHVIQENLGVTGTTAQEAADTLTGSTSAFEAALDNMLAGIADKDADILALRENLISTGETMFSNYVALIPTIVENTVAAIFGLSENAVDIVGDIRDEYTSAWVEIETTTTQALALVDALAKLEEGGLTEDEQTQWDALVQRLVEDVPGIASAISSSTDEIVAGSEAMREYIQTTHDMQVEVARLNAIESYNSELGALQVKVAENQISADQARLEADALTDLYNRVWGDALAYAYSALEYEAPTNEEIANTLSSASAQNVLSGTLQELANRGDAQAQAYLNVMKDMQTPEEAERKAVEAESEYQASLLQLKDLEGQIQVLSAAIEALAGKEQTVVVNVNNYMDSEEISSVTETRISNDANTKALTAGQ